MTLLSNTEMKPAHQKRSRKKAERMLKAGRRLVELYGYEGMRVSDVAEEAGCSVGSFYERFSDKDKFFKLMLEANLFQAVTDFENYLAPDRWQDVPVEKIISKFVYQTVHWFRRHKGLYRASLEVRTKNLRNFRPFHHHNIKASALLASLLKQRQDELRCDEIESSVWFAVQMISGTLGLAALSEIADCNSDAPVRGLIITIDNPEMITQLIRSTCAYLGVPQSFSHFDPPDKD